MYLSHMATDYSSVSSTQFVDLPEGRIAYDVTGEGPLLLLVPGMGDLRSAYRHLAPLLVEAGCRVATTDLRGHGDSDATFDSYGSVETAGDILAVIEQLGAPAVVVGNSMSAGSAAYAAAERPDLVCGLVLLGPFVRDGDLGAFTKAMLRVATAPPWAATMWKAYAPTLYAGRKPEDLDAHLSQLKASMKRPGYATSFSRTARVSHAPVEAGYQHSIATIMANAAYRTGQRVTFDEATQEVMAGDKVFHL